MMTYTSGSGTHVQRYKMLQRMLSYAFKEFMDKQIMYRKKPNRTFFVGQNYRMVDQYVLIGICRLFDII